MSESIPRVDRTITEASNFKLPALPDLISEALRQDIARGVLKPGAPIRMRPLAERFGVSAMPVREALRRLEAEGLVLFEKNRSITVNRLSAQEIDEVSKIRMELESLALRYAIPQLADDEETIASLGVLVRRMDDTQVDPDAWRTLNEEFHRMMYHAAAMPRLESLVTSVMSSIEPYIRIYVRTTEHIEHAQVQHRELLECTREGDVERACTVLRSHIQFSRDRLYSQLIHDMDAAS
jgi:DNA-binding GntR family transcriptional regulator